MKIREAQIEDAHGIACVNVESWRSTYTGLIPDSVLDNMSVENREAVWTRAIPSDQNFTYVAEDDHGQIIGYVSGGACREPGFDGELYAIYLLKSAQGQGIGRQLTHTLVQRLLDDGCKSMLVWVLEGNPACKFYEALGGQYVKRKTETFGGVQRDEVAYSWQDIRTIME